MNRHQSWATIALFALGLIAASASADDRGLLADSTANPYVMVIFDTSGSMHYTPECSAVDFNRPVGDPEKCDFLCPTGDCAVPLNGDDPASKAYLAKEALYEVISQVQDVQFGFATYNQDELMVRHKHYLYEVAPAAEQSNGLYNLLDGTTFPEPGSQEIFGWTEDADGDWDCVSTTSDFPDYPIPPETWPPYADRTAGCAWTRDDTGQRTLNPASITDDWEMTRVRRYPKLGVLGDDNQNYYITDTAGINYRIDYRTLSNSAVSGQSVGDSVLWVRLRVRRCIDAVCSFRTEIAAQRDIKFTRVDEFLAWDGVFGDWPTIDPRGPFQEKYYKQSDAADADSENDQFPSDDNDDTCYGWDGNSDGANDIINSYNLRWPNTNTTDVRGTLFTVGDVITFDWLDNHQEDILERLAPNTVGSSTATPDFATSPYFRDSTQPSELFLRLKNDAQRPLIFDGPTPLGGSLSDFNNYYDSFAAYASQEDPEWACRKKYVLFITDGDASDCDPVDACVAAAALADNDTQVQTYVVGFGVKTSPGDGNKLDCMAENGKTGEPLFPQNKQELVEALTNIFEDIKTESRAFSAASVPTVQRESADKLYISSFLPFQGEPFWSGQINAFRKPLPLDLDGLPDTSRVCGGTIQSGCLLWEAGAAMLSQAPTAADVASNNYKLGLSDSQRRVFYPTFSSLTDKIPGSSPSTLRLFSPPTTASQLLDYFDAFSLNGTAAQNALDTTRIIDGTLQQKNATFIDDDGNAQTATYIMGDIFHSDPRLLGSPNNFDYYLADLCGPAADPLQANNCPNASRGYKEFADNNIWRRKMLVVGTNDGQLHFMDAGRREEVSGNAGLTAVFNDGTGKELVSFMPRFVMPVLDTQTETVNPNHVFSVDGPTAVGDVMIDPVHNGSPVRNHREWRTVIIGGIREGGKVFNSDINDDFISGYYALDITQPDILTLDVPTQEFIPNPEQVVPTCIGLNAGTGVQQSVGSCDTESSEQIPFPAQLWSFTDRLWDPLIGNVGDAPYRLDEDDNGLADLGSTWSVPVITQLRVCEGTECDPAADPNDITVKYVAIFGGGADPVIARKSAPERGDWLYMVDIETGSTIYKRQLVVPASGAAPATPAVVDVNADGIADRIYLGTTAGYIYKVDLTRLDSSGDVPRIVSTTIPNTRLVGDPALASGNSFPVERILDSAWEPFPIFNTGGRPIYLPITTLFIPELGQYGLAVGTGDREDLWLNTGQEGRFYFIVDEGFSSDASSPSYLATPLTESVYETIGIDAAATGGDFVLSPGLGNRRGWVLELEENDRIITQAFSLVGVLVFTDFEPIFEPTIGSDIDGDGVPDTVCARTGISKVFVVTADNADPLADLDLTGDPGGDPDKDRYRSVLDFTTNPYVDQSATKNPTDPSVNDVLDDERQARIQEQIRESLKRFFPSGCRFNEAFNFVVDAGGSDTARIRYATIPIAMCPEDWIDR